MFTLIKLFLNFRDVIYATGKLIMEVSSSEAYDSMIGLEFSGRNSKGIRVMGLTRKNGFSTSVIADTKFLWEVPDKWSLEEASTIPVAYTTAYYALFVRGNLKKGESILIHNGSEAIGIASITLALASRCTVFTTVSIKENRHFLKTMFPQLYDHNIGYLGDKSFENLIMQQTDGKGVNLILNSHDNEILNANIRCLGYNGRFLQIDKLHFVDESYFGIPIFLKNIVLHVILLDHVFQMDSSEKTRIFDLINEGIDKDIIQPLPITVFNEDQLEEAFRYMATGNCIGKVAVKIRDEEKQLITQSFSKEIKCNYKCYMDPKKSYILVEGLCDFGLELGYWLISRGAKIIILSSRSGVRSGYQTYCIRRWRELGITVLVFANNLAPVGCIFNLDVVLKDNVQFAAVSTSKATFWLDAASRKKCPQLDHFVVFSSLIRSKDNLEQLHYSMCSSVMEKICEERHESNLPGLAVQLAMTGDLGVAQGN